VHPSVATAIALTFALAMPTAVRAQLCTGNASFRAGTLAIGAGAERTGDATLIRGQLSGGKAGGVFVSGNVGRGSFRFSEANSTVVGGSVGLEQLHFGNPRIAFCPVAGAVYETGDDGVIRGNTFAVSLGVSLARELPVSARASVIPFAHASIVRMRIRLTDVDDTLWTVDVHGMLRTGVGVVLNRRLTLQPNVGIRFGDSYGKPAFGIAAQVNFGARRDDE
jgi:hypothetical protein